MNEGLRAVVPAFVQAWNDLFGVYAPVEVKTGSYPNYDYHYIGPDFGYILRVVFFIIVVYCVLRIIGGVLKGGKR